MRLSPSDVEFFREKGFLLLEDWFSGAEVALINEQLPELFSQESPRRILEKNGAIRSVFGTERVNGVVDAVTRLRRMVESVMQLLDGQVYVYQTKFNVKQALRGDWWDWHQDFPYWHYDDGLRRPNVLTAAIFLDEVNEHNGPMLLIPGSHRTGVTQTLDKSGAGEGPQDSERAFYMNSLTADLKYTIPPAVLTDWIEESGIYSAKGRAGSILFFHGLTFHASSNNLSARDRKMFLVTYNDASNRPVPVENPRPDFLCSRDYTPLLPVDDHVLSEACRDKHPIF